MDIVDRASDEADRILENQIAAVKRIKHLKHNNKCHYCEEGIEGKKLFCNAFCSEDYDKEQKAIRIRGRVI